MLQRSRNRWAGGVLIALALIGAQAGRADEKTVNLIVKPKVGTETRYKSTVKVSVMGMDISIEATEKQTIKEVKDNGNVTVQIEPLETKINANGMEQDQKPGPPSTTTRDKLGKLVEYKAEEQQGSPFAPEVQKLMVSVSDTILTDKDVKEGDSWETEIDNPASKENKAKIKTTYLGMEKVDGLDCWKIKQTAEAVAGADGGKMMYDATIWTNPKDGQTQKVEAKIKDVPSQLGPLSFDMNMARLKADKAADTKKDDKDK